MKIDMSSEAITFRLKKVSELRKLCMALKLAGQKGKAEKPDCSHKSFESNADESIISI